VNVIARWHDIVERDARMVIELDEHDRAMDPVIEGAIIGDRTESSIPVVSYMPKFMQYEPVEKRAEYTARSTGPLSTVIVISVAIMTIPDGHERSDECCNKRNNADCGTLA
jgi:hypothetical protein